MANHRSDGFSAHVSACLRVNGHSLNLSHVGKDSCIVRKPNDVAPTNATVLVKIDDHETSREVYLVNGISRTNLEVRFVESPAESSNNCE